MLYTTRSGTIGFGTNVDCRLICSHIALLRGTWYELKEHNTLKEIFTIKSLDYVQKSCNISQYILLNRKQPSWSLHLAGMVSVWANSAKCKFHDTYWGKHAFFCFRREDCCPKMSSNTWCPFFDHFLCTTNLFSVIDFINVYIKLLGDWVSCKQSKSVIPLPNSAIKQSHTDVCSRPFYAQKQFIWYRMPVLRSKMMIYRDCTQSWFQVCCKQWTSGHLNSYNQWTGLVDWTVKLD